MPDSHSTTYGRIHGDQDSLQPQQYGSSRPRPSPSQASDPISIPTTGHTLTSGSGHSRYSTQPSTPSYGSTEFSPTEVHGPADDLVSNKSVDLKHLSTAGIGGHDSQQGLQGGPRRAKSYARDLSALSLVPSIPDSSTLKDQPQPHPQDTHASSASTESSMPSFEFRDTRLYRQGSGSESDDFHDNSEPLPRLVRPRFPRNNSVCYVLEHPNRQGGIQEWRSFDGTNYSVYKPGDAHGFLPQQEQDGPDRS